MTRKRHQGAGELDRDAMVRLHHQPPVAGERRFHGTRSRSGPIECCVPSGGPPAFHGSTAKTGARRASAGKLSVGMGVLSVAQPVVRFTMQSEVGQFGTAAERERHDVVDLQPIAGAATPAAVPVDIAATTLVAPPHLPPHGRWDVPRPGARPRAEAAQRGEVPLQSRRMHRRAHRANLGAVPKPIRCRSRKSVAAAAVAGLYAPRKSRQGVRATFFAILSMFAIRRDGWAASGISNLINAPGLLPCRI